MKKYKLIKEYPGSPSLNTEISKATIYRNKLHYKSFMIKGEDWFELVDPENYPEFWEEVIEKDYEILFYISKLKNCIIEPKDPLFNHGDWNIYSVKRLSDGEIFTIGDKIDLTKYEFNFPKSDILIKIKIINNKIRFKMNFQENHDWNSSYTLDYIQKLKQPLFTTEDGVDIFEGEYYSFVRTKDFSLFEQNCAQQSHVEQDKQYPGFFVNFSTKEKAEEYILMNKPCLSLNDIIEDISKATKIKNVKNTNMIKSLKELVNTKING